METPVVYFYSPAETVVRVGVRFPQGRDHRVVSDGGRRTSRTWCRRCSAIRTSSAALDWPSVTSRRAAPHRFRPDLARATTTPPVDTDCRRHLRVNGQD